MRQNNQAQLAYARIREKLISRTVDPGTRLTEKVWAASLNVNRADIRQALSRLLGEGLLETGEKGGFFVRDFSDDDMKQFDEVRFALESVAARFAVERASQKDINDLLEICEHMKLMAQNGYAMGVFEADLRFHQTFIKAAHNEKLAQIYAAANLPLSRKPGSVAPVSKLLTDAEDHYELVNALKEKDLHRITALLAKGLAIKSVE